MNFLNKKYTSLHGTSPYTQSNSRSFLPSASTVREGTMPSLSSNNCETHSNQLVRHLCLQCVELLCAECIGEHLQIHRQANVIPKIHSIKQVRAEMEEKLEHITGIMQNQNPAHVDLDGLRKRSLDRVEEMRRDLIRAVDEWVGIMRGHLLASIGFEDMMKTKNQMEKLCDEVDVLKMALQSGSQASVVKKVYQIDADKLQKGYLTMFRQYRELQSKAEFEFTINWKQIIKSFEAHINLKGKPEIVQQLSEQEQQSKRQSASHSQHSSPSHQESYTAQSQSKRGQ